MNTLIPMPIILQMTWDLENKKLALDCVMSMKVHIVEFARPIV